jgi:hypothetical protein
MSVIWKEEPNRFTFEGMTAERAPDDNAFVITSFGAEPDPDRVFAAIRSAMPFGQIRLRLTPETQGTIEALTGAGLIKCVRTVGTEVPEVGVVAIKTGK